MEDCALIEAQGSALTTQLAREHIVALMERLDAHTREGEAISAEIVKLGGESPAPLPAHLKTMCDLGNGHHRHCRDTLRAAFRALNSTEVTR